MKKWKVLMGMALCLAILSGCKVAANDEETINLTIWGSEQQQALLEEMAENFTKEHDKEADINITVCEESEGTCRGTVLFCPEAAADIFCFADDQLDSLVNADVLLPIIVDTNEVIEESGGADSVAVAAASSNHTLYAFPSTASNGYFLYYNSNYLSEEDVQSLDQILAVANKENKKFAMDFTSGWYLYSFYAAAGMSAEVTADGQTNTCNFNKTEGPYTGVDVTNSLIEIAKNPAFANVSNDGALEGLKDGSIIALVSGTWNDSEVKEAFGDGYAACKLPSFTVKGEQLQMHSVAGYKLFGVNAYSKNQLWAQKLARYITNEENQLKRFEVVGEGPANVKAAQSELVRSSVAIGALTN